MIQSKCKTKI